MKTALGLKRARQIVVSILLLLLFLFLPLQTSLAEEETETVYDVEAIFALSDRQNCPEGNEEEATDEDPGNDDVDSDADPSMTEEDEETSAETDDEGTTDSMTSEDGTNGQATASRQNTTEDEAQTQAEFIPIDEIAEPEIAGLETTELQMSGEEDFELKAAEPEAAESETAGLESTESGTVDQETMGLEVVEAEVADLEADEMIAETEANTSDIQAIESLVSNEYLFFMDDEQSAVEACSFYGGTLLRWSNGVGVMYCDLCPSGGDIQFYPQELYVVESSFYYEQSGECYTNIATAQELVKNPGEGVVIAVIDSGTDLDHPALADSILQAISVIPDSAYGDGGYFSSYYIGPQDYEGHGSHIAGILVGQTDEMTIGIVPDAQIISIKTLEKYGAYAAGTTEWLIRAIQYAISQKVDIINLSVGGSDAYVSAAQKVFRQAADAGILVVCATGNLLGYGDVIDAIDYPAAYDSTLAVSCVTIDGDDAKISGFSKYGEGTDLSAPGVGIYSCNATGSYASLSGTSMSCAVVSGIAGLLLSQDLSMSPQEVITILEKSAVDLGDTGYDTKYGWGVVNAESALKLMLPLQSEGGGEYKLPYPESDTNSAVEVPPEQQAEASNDWISTQQGNQVIQTEQPTNNVYTENTKDDFLNRYENLRSFITIGLLSLCGTGLFLSLRKKQKIR